MGNYNADMADVRDERADGRGQRSQGARADGRAVRRGHARDEGDPRRARPGGARRPAPVAPAARADPAAPATRDAHPHADPDPHADADRPTPTPTPDADTDADAHPDTDAHPDPDADADADTDPDADPHAVPPGRPDPPPTCRAAPTVAPATRASTPAARHRRGAGSTSAGRRWRSRCRHCRRRPGCRHAEGRGHQRRLPRLPPLDPCAASVPVVEPEHPAPWAEARVRALRLDGPRRRAPRAAGPRAVAQVPPAPPRQGLSGQGRRPRRSGQRCRSRRCAGSTSGKGSAKGKGLFRRGTNGSTTGGRSNKKDDERSTEHDSLVYEQDWLGEDTAAPGVLD